MRIYRKDSNSRRKRKSSNFETNLAESPFFQEIPPPFKWQGYKGNFVEYTE